MSFCMWSVIFPPVTSGIPNVTERFIFLFLLNQLLLLFEDDSQRVDILNILKCIHICCTTVILWWKIKAETFEGCSVCAWMCVWYSDFLSIHFCYKHSNSCCDTKCGKNFLTPVHEAKPAHTHSSRREAWERVFHFNTALLFIHNAKRPAGFLPYVIMHERETTAVPSPSSILKEEARRQSVGETRNPLHWQQNWHKKTQTEAKEKLWSLAFLLTISRSERKGSRKQAARQNRIAWRYRRLGYLLLCKTHKSITFYKQRFFSLWPLAHSQNSGANIHYNRIS